VFVVGLVINLVSRLVGAQASGRGWQFSDPGADADRVWGVFGDQSMAVLVRDWSRLKA
jgi:hypothetical protein